jgi:hypothetical protein
MPYQFRPYLVAAFWLLTGLALIRPLWASPQTSGLVAAYGFNESSGTTVTDVSVKYNNGTIASSVTRTTSSKYGSGLVFNGTTIK